jgi:DNA processing protein
MNEFNFSLNKNQEQKIAWLQLARTKGIGKQIMKSLLAAYGTPQDVIHAFVQDIDPRLRKFCLTKRKLIEQELEYTEKFGAQIMLACEKDFPTSLTMLDDGPLTLTYKGNKQLLTKPSIGIVGARNASAAGMYMAANFAHELAGQGFAIISGLARGIDGAAHKAALKSKLTIAVIAGGINHVYPREHEALFAQIADEGLLLAEAPWGNVPKAAQFPYRNRIISGLALGVLVIEAGLRSGSLSTANYALNQGKELFVVPGSPLDPRCQGCNLLIKKGAYLVENTNDILNELPKLVSKSSSLKESKSMECTKAEPLMKITEVANSLNKLLSLQPIHAEELAMHLNVPLQLVNQAIVELELAGLAERRLGNMVCRC